MEGTALRGRLQLQIFQIIVDDLAVWKAYLSKLLAADLDDLVDAALATRVRVVDLAVALRSRLWPRSRPHAA
jgi:hypothetical protein